MTAHYTSPQAWADGADPPYDVMSLAIVGASPVPLAGRTVLDLGAGTGATSRAITAAGGQPIAVDISHQMLAFRRKSRAPAVVADIAALPLVTSSVDGAAAAFALSHVDRPGDVLVECCRVSRPGSPVVAGVFAETGSRHQRQLSSRRSRASGAGPRHGVAVGRPGLRRLDRDAARRRAGRSKGSGPERGRP